MYSVEHLRTNTSPDVMQLFVCDQKCFQCGSPGDMSPWPVVCGMLGSAKQVHFRHLIAILLFGNWQNTLTATTIVLCAPVDPEGLGTQVWEVRFPRVVSLSEQMVDWLSLGPPPPIAYPHCEALWRLNPGCCTNPWSWVHARTAHLKWGCYQGHCCWRPQDEDFHLDWGSLCAWNDIRDTWERRSAGADQHMTGKGCACTADSSVHVHPHCRPPNTPNTQDL